MIKTKYYYLLSFMILGLVLISFKSKVKEDSNKTEVSKVWKVDFLDEFDTFNQDNWQDQRIWVNNEKQCYVPDNEF